MAGGKNLTEIQKRNILLLREENKTFTYISKKCGCHRSSVSRFLKKYDSTGNIKALPKGRPKRKTTAAQDRILRRIAVKNRFKSRREIRAEMKKQVGVNISVRTIGNRLAEFGLHSYTAVKKPLLTKKMKKNRLKFAKKYLNWTSDDWSRVLFSDESKFLLYGSDGKRYVRRFKDERLSDQCTIKTTRGRIGIMIWGCFSQRGLGKLHFIKGTVNASEYIKILDNYLLPSITELFAENEEFIFQQDNAPCHTAKRVRNNFIYKFFYQKFVITFCYLYIFIQNF